ncbi:MAG: hypothetical protein K6U89_13500 [Chloroflexi bacterium]|nr:hypothetical protein [Chloroflexota bacterium]
MRPLSATLAAACRALESSPVVSVEARDALIGVSRLRFRETLTTSPNAPEAPHGAGLFGNGALLRAYREGAVRWQVMPSPGPGSPWGSWSSWSTPGAGSAVGVAARGAFGAVAVDVAAATVQVRRSSDNGSSWSSWETAATLAGVGPVAVAINPAGVLVVVAARALGNGSWAVAAIQQSGSSWSAPVNHPIPLPEVTGLTAEWSGSDWVVAVSGRTPTGSRPAVLHALFGAGGGAPAGSWSPWQEVMAADLAVSFRRPWLHGNGSRLTLLEDGGTYQLVLATALLTGAVAGESEAWWEPWPTAFHFPGGVAVVMNDTVAYACHPRLVQRATLTSGLQLSDRVLEVEWAQPGRCRIVLDESRGTLPLGPGWEVTIDAGYRTAAGTEYPLTGPRATYWVERLCRRWNEAGRRLLELEGGDILWRLARWRTRRHRRWSGSGQLVARLVARAAGVGLTFDGSPGTLTPRTLAAPAGTAGLALIERALASSEDRLLPWGREARTYWPQPSDASCWTYRLGEAGEGEQPALRYREHWSAADPAVVRVLRGDGGAVIGHAIDPEDGETWRDPGLVVVDDTVANPDEAAALAARLVRNGVLRRGEDELESAPQVGQQVGDVVTVVLDGIPMLRRVQGLRTWYRRTGPRASYRQLLRLGPV